MKNYQTYYKKNMSFFEKVMSLDYQLIFLILLLAAISFCVMYSIDGGKIEYYTKNHILRFAIFFILFIFLSFTRIVLWHRSAYLIYFIFLLLLFAVEISGVTSSG